LAYDSTKEELIALMLVQLLPSFFYLSTFLEPVQLHKMKVFVQLAIPGGPYSFASQDYSCFAINLFFHPGIII